MLLGKRLRRQIRAKVWPVLEEAGFAEFAPLRAHRRRGNVIEVVEFTPFPREWREPRWLGGEAYANGATFVLHVGSYFRDVERLPWSETQERPKAGQCHRCARLAHESVDCAADGRTFWPGSQGERLDVILDEAVRVLQARGLAYLDHYGDVDGWLAAHERGEARHPGEEETVNLSADEIAEMGRICREGRAARSGKLDGFHRRVHLADEHLTKPDPCEDILAGLLIGKGRLEDAVKCLDDQKRQRLLQTVA